MYKLLILLFDEIRIIIISLVMDNNISSYNFFYYYIYYKLQNGQQVSRVISEALLFSKQS